MARSPGSRRSRSRSRRGRRAAARSRSRTRERRQDRSRSRDRVSTRRRSRSHSSRRRRSVSRKKGSRSKSRRPTRKRSRTPERAPPTSFADYEPATDGSGWYVYKKTAKWKFHPETALYLHIKSGVYYLQKDGDAKAFRKIEDDDDPTIRKMKQSEEMRKAIQSTEFVQFDGGSAGGAASSENGAAPPKPVGVAEPPAEVAAAPVKPAPQDPKKVSGTDDGNSAETTKIEGKVREWNSEKGFGFIVPANHKEGDENAKSIFVHLWNVVGSTHSNPINLREGARVLYKLGEQDGKQRALEVAMLGKDGKTLAVHAGAQTLEEKRKSYYVTAESIGVRLHCESWPGKQMELRDRYTADEPMDELGVCFGVFDGHGGSAVSELGAKQLHRNILWHFRHRQVQPASRDEKLKLAITEAFRQTDKEILGLAERKKFEQQGSTACMALLHGNPKLGTALRLVVANVGDSRAILCRAGQAVACSDDHKPDRLDEKKRIERAGGLVLNVRGAWRIAAPANPGSSKKASRREYQGLAMTRSLGDTYFKQSSPLSTPDPEVKVLPITDKDLFLILVTDGITNAMSNQDIVDCASRHWDNAEEAAKNIVRTAFQKGSDENLTAMVIQFGWQDKHTPKYIEKRKQLVARGIDGGSPTLKPSAADDLFSVQAKDDFDMFG